MLSLSIVCCTGNKEQLEQTKIENPLKGAWKMVSTEKSFHNKKRSYANDGWVIWRTISNSYFSTAFVDTVNNSLAGLIFGTLEILPNNQYIDNYDCLWFGNYVEPHSLLFNYKTDGKTYSHTGFGKFVYSDNFERIAEKPIESNQIKGVWLLISKEFFESPGKNENYENSTMKLYRIYTDNYWSVTKFDLENMQFDGTGGGTYSLENGDYSEYVNYLSWNMADVGRNIEFKIEVSDNTLSVIHNSEQDGYRENYKRIE